MHKSQSHKRTALTALLLATLLVQPAKAFTFTDSLFSIDIPEGEKTYYYTQRGTNMTGTMLENAQKQDMVLLIGSYNEAGTLQYTFKVENIPGKSAEELRNELSGQYELSEPGEETVAGVPGQSLSGWSVQNSNYAIKVYLVGDAVLTTMYQPMAELDVERLLDTVQWAGSTAMDPTMERDPDAVPLPGVTFKPEEIEPEPTADIPAVQPLEPVNTEREPTPAERLAEVLGQWGGPLLLGLAGATVLGLLILLRPKRKKRRGHVARHQKREYAPKHARRS